MHYLLAGVGALAIAVLLWRAFNAERVGVPPERRSPVAPDDDPDFLRKLGEQQRKKKQKEDEQ